MTTQVLDSFSLAEDRFLKAEERSIKAGGYGSTKRAMALINRNISKATDIITRKLVDTSRSSMKDINTDLCQLDPDVLALVALQGGIDCIGGQESLNRTFHILGGMVDREMFAQSLKGFNKKLSASLEKDAKRRGASVKYRRQAVSAQARKEGFVWKRWSKDRKAQVGMWLVEVLTELEDVFIIVRYEDEINGKQSFLTLTEEALAYSQAMVTHLINSRPVSLPLLSEPPNWDGYHLTLESNGRTYKTPLIRKGGLNATYVKAAIAEGRMTPVLEGVSYAGAVPYRINERILAVVKATFDLGIEVEGMPMKNDLVLPEKMKDEDWATLSEDEQRLHRSEIGQMLGRNRSLVGERCIYDQDIATAEYLIAYGNRFWTPMNLDYRGRVYGAPYFSYQRQDYVRGMFLLDNGMKLGDDGIDWLMVHIANTGDFNKVSKDTFEARIEWVKANHKKLLRVAARPLDDMWWTEADKPFCFLAACMGYAEYVADPEGYVNHIPINFDGTCSGLQHLAAMTRCESTAPLVNLTPNLKPADVYGTVAIRLKAKVERITDGEFALVCQKALAFGIDRGLVKRNTMTYTYGSKKYGMTQQLMEDLMRPLKEKVVRKKIAEHPFEVPEDTFVTDKGVTINNPGRTAAKLLGPMTFETIEEVVQRPAEAMRFLQTLSKAMSHEGKPTIWHTPLGFPVVLNYPNQTTNTTRLWMQDHGVRVKVQINTSEDAPGIDKVRTANAVAPCFVHSYDACHLMMVVIHANRLGIKDIVLVHDSFGCQPAQATAFRKVITDTFHQLYTQNDVLNDILQESSAQIHTNHHRLPERSDVSTGSYDLNLIKESSYAFA